MRVALPYDLSCGPSIIKLQKHSLCLFVGLHWEQAFTTHEALITKHI